MDNFRKYFIILIIYFSLSILGKRKPHCHQYFFIKYLRFVVEGSSRENIPIDWNGTDLIKGDPFFIIKYQ